MNAQGTFLKIVWERTRSSARRGQCWDQQPPQKLSISRKQQHLHIGLLQCVDLSVDVPQSLGVGGPVELRTCGVCDLLEHLLVEWVLLRQCTRAGRTQGIAAAHTDGVQLDAERLGSGCNRDGIDLAGVVDAVGDQCHQLALGVRVLQHIRRGRHAAPHCGAVLDPHLVSKMHVIEQTDENAVVQGGRTLDERLLREHDETDAVILPVVDEVCDDLFRGPKSVRDEVRLAHAAGNVESDGNVHALSPDDLSCIRHLWPRGGGYHKRQRQEAQHRHKRRKAEAERPPGAEDERVVSVPHAGGSHSPTPQVGEHTDGDHRRQQKEQPGSLETQAAHADASLSAVLLSW